MASQVDPASLVAGQADTGGRPPRHVGIIMDGNGRWAAARGLPRSEGHRKGVEAVRRAVQAAIDGIGVAMGRTSYVQDDIAKGRLVVPFKIALPTDAGFYLVSPEGVVEPPKLAAFRKWLVAATRNKA